MDMTIDEFCDYYGACAGGRAWAQEHCETMQDVWAKLPGRYLVWVAARTGVVDEAVLRRCVCLALRRVWDLLDDERSRRAVECAERYLEGAATDEELYQACRGALSAALSLDCGVFDKCAYAADAASSVGATRDSVGDVAHTLGSALWDVACALSADSHSRGYRLRDIACDKELEVHAQWLRDNATPCFDVTLMEKTDCTES
jgi:hypothetical protein